MGLRRRNRDDLPPYYGVPGPEDVDPAYLPYFPGPSAPGAGPQLPPKAALPRNMMLAHAYVLWQEYGPPFFPPGEALRKGTIFPELYGLYEQEDF